MTIVVDASVAAAWVLPDESSEAADAILRRVATEGASTPELFWHELRNIFLIAARRNRLPEAEIVPSLLRLRRLPIEGVNIASSGDGALIALARQYNLTSYDAAYLQLALDRGTALATADRALRVAAKTAGLPLA